MNLIEVNAKIGGVKVFVRLLNSLQNDKMPKPEKVYEIIKGVFKLKMNFDENTERILHDLQPYALEVKITPSAKGYSYNYTYISRK